MQLQGLERREWGQICRQGGLFGEEIGNLFLRDQPRRGSQCKNRNVSLQGSWGNLGTHACTFLSTNHLWRVRVAECPRQALKIWNNPRKKKKKKQPPDEYSRRLQNKNKKTGELQISTVFLENSLAPWNKSHLSVPSLWPHNPSSGNIHQEKNRKGNGRYLQKDVYCCPFHHWKTLENTQMLHNWGMVKQTMKH